MFLVIYALSGAAGLLYEVAWARLLALHMGHTAAAASTVLAAYMGGLAAGSLAGSRLARRVTRRRALALYAAFEAVVAASALLLPVALSALQPVFARAYADGAGGPLFGFVRLAASLLLLIVPTTAMGATFPVAVRAFVVDDEAAGRQTAALYAVNTVGAAVGAVLAGFVLLPATGLRITTWVGCFLNVAAASGALMMARQPIAASRTTERPPVSARRAARTGGERAAPQLALAAAALACSGFAALVNEVGWTRLLAVILGPTSYAFAAMLVAFITGLATGASAGTRLSARRSMTWLAISLGAAAVASAVVVPLASRLPLVVAHAVSDPNAAFAPIVWTESGLAAALLLPMAVAFGAAFPLAIRVAARSADTAPSAAATIYAANTAGAILGALFAGFVLIPQLGLQRTIALAAAVTAVSAAVVAFAGVRTALGRATIALACAVMVGGLVAMPRWDRDLLASGAYKYAPYVAGVDTESALTAGTTLFYAEGATGIVTVRRVAGATTLAIDGKIDASNRADMLTQKLLAHLPLLLQASPRTVCIIGLGSGVTVGAAASHPVDRIDVVEISPEVVRASAFFDQENHHALSDPRTRLIVGDGRSHLLLGQLRYDAIISEPSNPWISGMSALFTREFFQAARARLTPDGLFCQWTHSYDMSRADLQSIVATFRDVFPAGTAWLVGAGDVLLIGGRQMTVPDPQHISRNWPRPRVRQDLAEVAVTTPFSLTSLEVSLAGLLDGRADVPLQTDDRMALEYSAPRAIFGRTRTDDAAQPLTTALSPDRLALGAGALPASPTAVEWLDRGRMLLAAEAGGPAYESFRRAVGADPGDAEALDGFAQAARLANRAKEAVALLESIRQRDRTNVVVRVQLSHLIASEGSWEAAVAAAREALAIDPASARAREQLASIYADREDASGLAPLAGEMMRRNPERPESAYFAGTSEMLSGRFAEAARFADAATRANPKYAGAWILAGAAYGSLGDRDRAQASFGAAIAADPRNPVAYLNLGMLQAASGQLDEAASTFAEALIVEPSYEPARVALADVLERMGETRRAAALRSR